MSYGVGLKAEHHIDEGYLMSLYLPVELKCDEYPCGETTQGKFEIVFDGHKDHIRVVRHHLPEGWWVGDVITYGYGGGRSSSTKCGCPKHADSIKEG